MHPAQSIPAKPLTVTVQKARELTGLGNTTLYELMKTDRLRFTAVGGRRLIVYASIEELLGLKTAA